MRRMENDLLFFHELIGNCSVEKDSKIYTISPKFGKGTMQSFEVMPGAEIVYSNVYLLEIMNQLIKSKLSAFYAYLDICQTKMLEIVDNRAALNFHIS